MKSVERTILLTVLFQVCSVWSYTRWEKENVILKNILSRETYNPEIRPGRNSTYPVLVRVNMYIRSIAQLDETKMEYSIQVTFRQQWTDERLAFEGNSGIRFLTLADPSRIWTPDPFFTNENSGYFHNIVKPNVLLRIFPNGDVLYSSRLSLTLKCLMDLKYFPMDQQTCHIILASYAYTTEDIVFLWKKGDPVQISRNLNIRRFALERFSTDLCTSRTNTGEFSCIKVDLLFGRQFTPYFIDIYLPTIVLVMLSWLCFALNHKDTTARVVLFASVFIVFSLKLVCINSKVPVTSYQTAYSIWITTCFVFLSAVIAKVGYDAFLLRKQQRKEVFESTSDENDIPKNKLSSEEPRANVNAVLRVYHRLMRRYPCPQQKTDVICLILFPVVFTLFNIFYWSFNVQPSE